LWFFLGMGCATIIREAVQRDMDANNGLQGTANLSEEMDDEELQTCPIGKIRSEDCRVTPCKVMCVDPKELER
jgi:hypothetical protein